MTVSFVARGGARLAGRVRPPGDKSIAHRAVILASLAEGISRVEGLPDGEDVGRTLDAVAMLGAQVSTTRTSGERSLDAVITGGGGVLHEAGDVIYCGNSGTSMRLLSGMAAGFPWCTVLTGDQSLRERPMRRVAEPLRRMGACVDGRDHGGVPPLVIRGGDLVGVDEVPAVPSAQVKGAILLAGLRASGTTSVSEAVTTRRHMEELLELHGAGIACEALPGGGQVARVSPGVLGAAEVSVPGDPSQGAFWVAAGLLCRESSVTIVGTYQGRERAGYLRVLARMGARLEYEDGEPAGGARGRSVGASSGQGAEPAIVARTSRLVATEMAPREVPDCIDEIPLLAVVAAMAEGISRFSGLGELRVKESDRLAAIEDLLTVLGASAHVEGDDLVIAGRAGEPFEGGAVDARHDHRIAMAAAIAGLASTEGITVTGWESVATSYPGFADDLAVLARW